MKICHNILNKKKTTEYCDFTYENMNLSKKKKISSHSRSHMKNISMRKYNFFFRDVPKFCI